MNAAHKDIWHDGLCPDCKTLTYDGWVGVCRTCGYMYKLHLKADYVECGINVNFFKLLPDSSIGRASDSDSEGF
jgi:hypothetical protein